MLILSIVESIASMIDCELDIIRMEWEHPERFISKPASPANQSSAVELAAITAPTTPSDSSPASTSVSPPTPCSLATSGTPSSPAPTASCSTSCVSPLIKWNGSVAELLEYTIPLYVAGKFLTLSGEPATWAGTVKLIEIIFGISVPDLYDRKTKLLNRYKNTAFIDEMRQVLIEESQK